MFYLGQGSLESCFSRSTLLLTELRSFIAISVIEPRPLKKIMKFLTPEVLRMLEMDDDMECETDVEEPICEGSEDDLGLEISDEEERLAYCVI